MDLTISVVGDKKGKHVRPLHTIRKDYVINRERYTSVDKQRKDDDIILINHTDVKEKDYFNSIFKNAIDEYNNKQKRADRKKSYDYYKEFQQDNRGKGDHRPIHEMILQIGNEDIKLSNEENAKILKESFEEFLNKFGKYIDVYAAAIHLDETTPHLHIDFIAKSYEYKRGLSMQASLTKACQEMGFESKLKDNQYLDKDGNLQPGKTMQSAYITFMEEGVRPILEEKVKELGHNIYRPLVVGAKHDDINIFKKKKEIETLNTNIDELGNKQIELEKNNRELTITNFKLDTEKKKIIEEKNAINETIAQLAMQNTNLQNNIIKLQVEYEKKLKEQDSKLKKEYSEKLKENQAKMELEIEKQYKPIIEEKNAIIAKKDNIIKEKDNTIKGLKIFEILIEKIKEIKPNLFNKFKADDEKAIDKVINKIAKLFDKADKYDKYLEAKEKGFIISKKEHERLLDKELNENYIHKELAIDMLKDIPKELQYKYIDNINMSFDEKNLFTLDRANKLIENEMKKKEKSNNINKGFDWNR